MKKIILIIVALIATGLQSFAGDFKIIDLSSMSETSKDISGRNMKPLVIAGSEGYPAIPIMANYPEIADNTYIDFNTGERTTKILNPAIKDYEVTSSENGLIEITINGAYVHTDEKLIPGKEFWYVWGATSTFIPDTPVVTIIPIKFPLLLDDVENQFTLVGTESIDFADIDCMPNFVGVGILDGDDTHYDTIKPYSGYWPENVIWSIENTGHKPQHVADRYVEVALAPCQYDYENKVMKVHRKILLQRNIKNSGVINIENISEEVSYYSIDGRRVDNPQTGQLYIRKTGDKYTKIIF